MTRRARDPEWSEPTARLWDAIASFHQTRSLDPIRIALADGADPNAASLGGVTMLLAAAPQTDWRLFQILIDGGASLIDEQGRCLALIVARRLHYPAAEEARAFLESRVQALKERDALLDTPSGSPSPGCCPRL